MKWKESQLFGCTVALWSFIETFAILVLAVTAWATADQIVIMFIVLFFWVLLILTNIFWVIYFRKEISKDPAFQDYKKRNKKTAKVILILSALFSFKISRFYYNRFFGFDYFSATFESKDRYRLPLAIFSAVNFGIIYLPILILDIACLFYLSWGS